MTELAEHQRGPKSHDDKRVKDKDAPDSERKDARDLSPEQRAERSGEEVNQYAAPDAVEGANQHLSDVTSGRVFGDTTSSSGGANNPGQHGRDGGDINGEDNNPTPEDPTPEEEAPPPEGGATRRGGKEESVRKL